MEKTPIELYETAYRAHYIEKKIPDAVEMYEALIREFPDSNECGYAVIQLQKIKSSDFSKQIRRQKNLIYTVAVSAFIFACISIFACGAITYYFKTQLKIEQNKTSQTISAFSKILNGDNDGALQVLDKLKGLDKKSVIPFELSSGIYQTKKKYQEALNEYESFFRLNPNCQPSPAERQIMENCKAKVSSQVKNVKSIKIEKVYNQSISENVSSTANTVPKTVQKNISDDKKPGNDVFVVDPDSLSYF